MWWTRTLLSSLCSAPHRRFHCSIHFRPRAKPRQVSTYIMSASNPFSSLLDRQDVAARLAVLKPAADWDAPLELTLTDAVLKDTSYEVISYDRSPKPKPTGESANPAEDDAVTVLVDGEDQSIPKALESALRTFRRKEKPRTFWADVLVGRTVEERSAQASTQRAVLENAERTLCWLGPDQGEATTKAFETIHEMSRRIAEAYRQNGLDPDASFWRSTMQQMAGIRQHLESCPYNDLNSFSFRHWDVIYGVFGASYWGTVQCISEIVLAKSPIVVCGRSNIRWAAYIGASRALPIYQGKFFKVPLLPNVMKGFMIANEVEIAMRRRRLNESIELLPMIQTARGCRPSDPRECVFSMQLIATPSGRTKFHSAGPQPLPTIDYTKTVQQVFTEAARYTILERQDLLLWYNERPPRERRLQGLPSWVPDFYAMPPRSPSHVNLFSPVSGMRGWWDDLKASIKKPITISGNELHLQVYPLDRIVHVSPVFNTGNCRRLCLSEFQKLPPHTSTTETSVQRDERFWRTLILNGGKKGNTMEDNIPPSSMMGIHFHSLIAEEKLLKELGCTRDTLQTSPETMQRIRDSPELSALAQRLGKGAPYENLLMQNSMGRRFFRTASGRFGMSAIEDVVAADSDLSAEDKEPLDRWAELRRADLGRVSHGFLGAGFMREFQQFVVGRDANAGQALALAMQGELPGINENDMLRDHGGVQDGDIIVACIGGLFPDVFRPRSRTRAAEGEERSTEGEESSSRPSGASEEDSSTYEFIGECYLHGAMDGEDFKAVNMVGQKVYRLDASKLVDITVV
ncbi:hypothetical protein F5Y04DRAFT_264837 [Hypomontagnella monticulosa]|nr:hypothetical protein F5Y04DRAFT_264837 [Hypomontagnella monticulosa]